MFIFIYTETNIQYEKYKLKCYIMKKVSLSVIVSYKNVVNQTDTYKIVHDVYAEDTGDDNILLSM